MITAQSTHYQRAPCFMLACKHEKCVRIECVTTLGEALTSNLPQTRTLKEIRRRIAAQTTHTRLLLPIDYHVDSDFKNH
jgi:hypothetical protein